MTESIVIFIPNKLMAIWIGIEKAAMLYKTKQQMINAIKLQYISHKIVIDLKSFLPFKKRKALK